MRQVRRADAWAIQRRANDASVARFLPRMPHPYTIDDARQWINRTHRQARNGTGCHFGIACKVDGEIIGAIGLGNVNRQDRNAEVGYWLGKDFRRRGYATEAMQLVLRFAFSELNLARVYAVVHQDNVESFGLLEKCGFTKEGVWRRASFLEGSFRDVFAYGILMDEFAQPSGR